MRANLFFKEEDGDQHNEDGRRVQQDDGDRSFGMNDRVKVADIKKDDAYNARPEKHPYIAQANAKQRRRNAKRHQRKHRRRDQKANEAYLRRGKPCGGKRTNKNADHAP